MSYDFDLTDPVTGETLHAEGTHQIRGGTYALGGTTELSLNITYNYSRHFCQIFGSDGIHILNGKTGAETIPLLKEGISKLGNDVQDDYWQATEGNAKQALHGLLAFATMRPDGVWKGG